MSLITPVFPGDVRTRYVQSFVGRDATSSYLDNNFTLVNKAPQAAQVSTLTVSSGVDGHVYTWVLNGITQTYTLSGTSKVVAAAGIAAAISGDPLTGGVVTAESDGIDTVTLTAIYPGIAFTLTESDADLTHATTTSAATADPVSFGVAMVTGGYADTDPSQYGTLPKTANFTAQVATLSPVYHASVTYGGEITFQGKTVAWGPVTANTDTATTCTDIATAINAIMDATFTAAQSVVAAATTTTVTLTSEIVGEEFAVSSGNSGGTNYITQALTTGPSTSTSVARAFRGVSRWTTKIQLPVASGANYLGATAGQYPPNGGVETKGRGFIFVSSAESPTMNDPVYVELGSTGTGQFYKTGSASRVWLPSSLVQWQRPQFTDAPATDDLAVLSITAA